MSASQDRPIDSARTARHTSAPTAASPRSIRIWSALVLGALAVALLATVARVAQLKVAPDERLADAMERDSGLPIQFVERGLARPRGTVFDRRGQVVAMDVPGWRLFVDTAVTYREALKSAERTAARGGDVSLDPFGDLAVLLADRIGVSPQSLLSAMVARVPTDLRSLNPSASDDELARLPRYAVLDQQLSDAQVEALRGVRTPGVALARRQVRVYPFGSLAAQLIGKVGFEHAGLSGTELRQNRQLSAEPGSVVRLVDNRGQTIAIPADGYDPGAPGEAIQLSIDMIVQQIVETKLEERVASSNANGGRAMVVDVDTGEILAMYDTIREKTGRSLFITDPNRRLDPALGRCRCVTDPFEPGSIFKPFVWSLAIVHGKAKPTDRISLPDGPLVLREGSHTRTIHDVKYNGTLSWRDVLVKSVNAGMATVAMRLSKKEMREGLLSFGFGSRTGCGIPGESAGLLTRERSWTMLHTQASVSFGQEISVTPAQLLRAFTAFCRDGSMVELSLRRADQRIAPRTQPVLPESVVVAAREAMRGVLTDGTGKRAERVAKYNVFGKSGTAELAKGGTLYKDRYTSSFLAGAPFEHPKIAVIVVIDDPDKHKLGHNNYGGGAIAGPTAVEIINEVLEYMGVPPRGSEAGELPHGSVALAPAE